MPGKTCPPATRAKPRPKAAGERYMKQYAQAQALRRRGARKSMPMPVGA